MGASRTNRDRLDLDTVFNMSIGGIIRILMLEDVLAAERVDKGGSAYIIVLALYSSGRFHGLAEVRECAPVAAVGAKARGFGTGDRRESERTSSRGTANHEAELNALLDVLLAADHFLGEKELAWGPLAPRRGWQQVEPSSWMRKRDGKDQFEGHSSRSS